MCVCVNLLSNFKWKKENSAVSFCTYVFTYVGVFNSVVSLFITIIIIIIIIIIIKVFCCFLKTINSPYRQLLPVDLSLIINMI